MTSRLDAFKGTDSPERTALKASIKSARANAGTPRPTAKPVRGMVAAPSATSAVPLLGAGAAAGAANAILEYKAKQKAALDKI